MDTTNSGLECKSGEQDDIPKDTRHEPLDVHESESEVEAEIFDDGEDTADDDVIDIQGDNEDDLAALMAASTTIKTAPRHRQNIMNKNKKLKDRKALLKMLECDTVFSDPLVDNSVKAVVVVINNCVVVVVVVVTKIVLQKEEKETAFAQAYLQRVKEAVGCNEKLFEEFIKVLYDFSNSGRNVVNVGILFGRFYDYYYHYYLTLQKKKTASLFSLNFVCIISVIPRCLQFIERFS